jgi:HAD superfamily hydrolase (TIGR01450 family)
MGDEWWTVEDEGALEDARKRNNDSKRELLNKKLFVFDQDGTTYIDFKPLPGATEIFRFLVDSCRRIVFISNNSSVSSATYREKLSGMLGIDISPEQVHTSTSATIEYLRSNNIERVYALGTPEFEEELGSHGITLTDSEPQLIVVAFDKTLTYEKLRKACLMILNGVEYVATHPDNVCPTLEGNIPDTGSFLALIETATEIRPKAILGKPNPEMVDTMLERFSLSRDDAIIFGDRIYTDMVMGRDGGITTALMLTGESSMKDVKRFGVDIDLIFEDLNEVLTLLKKVIPR